MLGETEQETRDVCGEGNGTNIFKEILRLKLSGESGARDR